MRAAVERVAARIAAELIGLPGLRVTRDGGRIAVSARRLRARWIADARLRWIGR